MGSLDLKKILLGSSLLLGVTAMGFVPAAYAQDDDGVAVIEDDEATADNEDDDDTVVVTGSRIKRNSFNSIAPLQVISGEISREVGLIDPAQILQESTAATGQQIDSTFTGFVLDNGPGSSTLDLRGLGANRTLVLINGRRVAPAGVEGAPSIPDLNLIPGSLIERYDVLLDGASSVYGSDAIAGVANAILRKDFEGLELEFFGEENIHQSGIGDDFTVNGSWGKNTDRGFFGAGFEYNKSDQVTLADRPWTDGCDTDLEIDENGMLRNLNLFDQVNNNMLPQICTRGGLVGRTFIPNRFGSVYFTPGLNNYLPGFSESGQFGVGVDQDGDGLNDVQFQDFSTNGRSNDRTLFPDFERISLMGYGEYTFEGEANLTPFFEAIYSKRETMQKSGNPQLFPYVPADNPFNICNPAAVGGVDCGLAFDAFLAEPTVVQGFIDNFGAPPTAFGFLFSGPIGAIPTEPIVAVQGDRSFVTTEVEQLRLVGGLKGDLPGVNWGQLNDWSFELSGIYSESTGSSSRPGIRDDRLAFALGWDPTIDNDGDGLLDFNTSVLDGNLVPLVGGACDPTGTSAPVPTDVSAGCVPVNLYAPSLYNPRIGDFATQAERDYLFDSRDFDTTYKQTTFSAFASGNIWSLPAGEVGAVIGAEFRRDEIESNPDNIARDGLFFGFFADGGAVGERDTQEVYGELEIPVFANAKFAKELTVNLSGRYTDDEFYGGNETYSAKASWRPIDPLLFRATTGTSFRAPNLRELFLRDQTGFNTISDPCAVPDDALGGLGGVYDPTLDQRDPIILANCIADGVDPTTLGVLAGGGGAIQAFSVEIAQAGTFDLLPEESESYSVGFVFEQPFFESFDLSVAVDHYDIEIDNTVIEPSSAFIVADCYVNNANFASTFCNRITRNFDGTGGTFDGQITFIDAGFINRDRETAAGIDINVLFEKELTLWNQPVDIAVDVRANHILERTTLFTNTDGSQDFDTFPGEPGFAEWRGISTFRADIDDYRFTWSTRYIEEVEQDPDFVDAFGNAILGNSGTCLGPTAGDVNCRDVGFIDEYFVHSASVYYRGDSWTLGAGVRNVFDKEPPQVNGTEILAFNNTPVGIGYDLNGRTFFIDIAKDFN